MGTSYEKKTVAIISLLIINLTLSALVVLYLFTQTEEQHNTLGGLGFESVKNGQYILYIGTNDKDTYQQIIPTAQAKEIVSGICDKYVKSYTVSVAEGNWVNEKGVAEQEDTLIYLFYGAQESNIIAIMDEVLVALNQDAILVERRNVSSTFYDGKD